MTGRTDPRPAFGRERELVSGTDHPESMVRYCALEASQQACLDALPDAAWVTDLRRRYLDVASMDALV